MKMEAKKQYSAAIVGARGYSGLELVHLLTSPASYGSLLQSQAAGGSLVLQALFASKDFDLKKDILDPAVLSIPCYKEEELLNHQFDFVFLATPAEVSLKWAPILLEKGSHVIDVSGAFRLKNNSVDSYKKWYNFEHTHPDLAVSAVYGLQPWCAEEIKNQVQGAKGPVLIANPGCYATACLMPLVPLLQNNIIDSETVVLDGKSGTSGAGRKAEERLLFTEVDGDCLPYRVGQHQHTPEIIEAAKAFSGIQIDPFFSTSLLSTPRGLTVALYAKIHSSFIGQSSDSVEAVIEQAFAKSFAQYPWVRWQNLNKDNNSKLLSLKSVQSTPYTHISFSLKNNKLYVFSVIDNLCKGAASQALENAYAIVAAHLSQKSYLQQELNQ